MFNMKNLDMHKFTVAVLCVGQTEVELELMDPDEDSDSDVGP